MPLSNLGCGLVLASLPTIICFLVMEESVSHAVADFIDHANQLRKRLRKDGEKLTVAEVDILRAQLHDLIVVANDVQEMLLFKARHREGEDAA